MIHEDIPLSLHILIYIVKDQYMSRHGGFGSCFGFKFVSCQNPDSTNTLQNTSQDPVFGF